MSTHAYAGLALVRPITEKKEHTIQNKCDSVKTKQTTLIPRLVLFTLALSSLCPRPARAGAAEPFSRPSPRLPQPCHMRWAARGVPGPARPILYTAGWQRPRHPRRAARRRTGGTAARSPCSILLRAKKKKKKKSESSAPCRERTRQERTD